MHLKFTGRAGLGKAGQGRAGPGRVGQGGAGRSRWGRAGAAHMGLTWGGVRACGAGQGRAELSIHCTWHFDIRSFGRAPLLSAHAVETNSVVVHSGKLARMTLLSVASVW